MKAWLISIIGVSFLGVMLDVILKDSFDMKFIKSIYSLVVVYVIICPIVSFVLKLKNFDFQSLNFELDESFVYQTNNVIIEKEIGSFLTKLEIREFNIIQNETFISLYINENISDETKLKIQEFMKKFNKEAFVEVIE